MIFPFITLTIICTFLIFSGCSKLENDNNNNDNNENIENNYENNNNEENDNNANNDSENNNETKENEDYRLDQGNLNIWFEAEVEVDEEVVTVKGESNLLPNTIISSSGIKDNWRVDDYGDTAEVQNDGTFEFEFPTLDSEVEVELSINTTQDFVAEHYGENLEKAKGNQVYKTDVEGEYVSRYVFTIDPLEEKPYTIYLTTPNWEESTPPDYGDTNVWMEVEATTKHNFLYFEGRSNILEGALIKGRISDPENLISSAWSSSSAEVNPDGSFQMKIHYWDLREDIEMNFSFDPNNSNSDHIIEKYGEEGEKLTGELVKKWEHGGNYIHLSVPLAGPGINAPEEVDLSIEEDEVKMQVPDDLLFDFGKSDLKTEAKETLDELIEDLSELPNDTHIQINGHTENVGGADFNMNLSEERAYAVADYIEESGKLDYLSMKVQGFGKEKPIASNEDEEGRQRNRRVEIVINPE